MVWIFFMVWVFCVLLEEFRFEILFQFCYGLFGDCKDVWSGDLDVIVEVLFVVFMVVDWMGMKDDDIVFIILVIVMDILDFLIIFDCFYYGYMEVLMVVWVLQGFLGRDEVFQLEG